MNFWIILNRSCSNFVSTSIRTYCSTSSKSGALIWNFLPPKSDSKFSKFIITMNTPLHKSKCNNLSPNFNHFINNLTPDYGQSNIKKSQSLLTRMHTIRKRQNCYILTNNLSRKSCILRSSQIATIKSFKISIEVSSAR